MSEASRTVSTSTSAIGAYGKLPCQGDFVRLNAGAPAALEFARWLEAAHESLHLGGSALPRAPLNFVYSTAAAAEVLIGTLAPSKDSVGRVFPMAVFEVAPGSEVAARLAQVPLGHYRFFTAAAELLAGCANLPVKAFGEKLAGLAQVPREWSLAEAQRQFILGAPAKDLLQAVDSAPPQGRTEYAFHTLLTACSALKGQEQPKAKVVLDCPLPGDGPLAWVELVARLLRWGKHPPALFWNGERLLVSLGSPGSGILTMLVQPQRGGATLWPLKTAQASAMDNAKKALTAEQRRVLSDPEVSLSELLDGFAR